MAVTACIEAYLFSFCTVAFNVSRLRAPQLNLLITNDNLVS